jgi:hypothetical protein
MLNLSNIETLIYARRNATKGEIMDAYKKYFPEIREIDSAFPIGWGDKVRAHFGVRNIGTWAWAYGDATNDHVQYAAPIPCCTRSLAYLEAMIGMGSPLIYPERYITKKDAEHRRWYKENYNS